MFEKKRTWLIILGFIFILAGADVIILLSHLTKIAGILFLAAGIAMVLAGHPGWRENILLLFHLKRKKTASFSRPEAEVKAGKTKESKKRKTELAAGFKDSIAHTILNIITFDGSFRHLLTAGGIILIGLDLFYNFFLQKDSALSGIGSHDTVVLICGTVMILYNFIPEKYIREATFILFFFIFLVCLLVVPVTVLSRFYNTEADFTTEQPNMPVVHYLLAVPVAFIVNLLPIDANPSVDGIKIFFFSKHTQQTESISIGLSCTGLYSVSIFLSAFLSFVFIEYSRFSKKVLVLMAAGITTSYVANLLRMTLIIVAGYFNGVGDHSREISLTEQVGTLLWVHEYLGEVLFIFWISIFWFVMYKVVLKEDIDSIISSLTGTSDATATSVTDTAAISSGSPIVTGNKDNSYPDEEDYFNKEDEAADSPHDKRRASFPEKQDYTFLGKECSVCGMKLRGVERYCKRCLEPVVGKAELLRRVPGVRHAILPLYDVHPVNIHEKYRSRFFSFSRNNLFLSAIQRFNILPEVFIDSMRRRQSDTTSQAQASINTVQKRPRMKKN